MIEITGIIKHYATRYAIDKVVIPCGEKPRFPNFVQEIKEVTCEKCLIEIEKQIAIARDQIGMTKIRENYGDALND